MTWNIKNKHGNKDLVLWNGTIKKKKKKNGREAIKDRSFFYSLVAPVQSRRYVLLDVPHAVMGEVAHQHLPPQVQDFIHHVPKSVEQIPLVPLWKRETVEVKKKNK